MADKQEFLECGKIINTHGIKGALKLEYYCDSAEVLAGLKTLYFFEGGLYSPKKVLKTSIFKRFVIAIIEDIDDIDKAIPLKNKIVYAAREDLPTDDGAVFITDIIGLPVKDVESGVVYGTLSDVVNNGASDLYVIKTDNGEKLIPAVAQFIKKIDLDEGIFIEVIPGLLD